MIEIMERLLDQLLEFPITGWALILGSGWLYLFTKSAMDTGAEESATIFGGLLFGVGVAYMIIGPKVFLWLIILIGIALLGLSLFGMVLLFRSIIRMMFNLFRS